VGYEVTPEERAALVQLYADSYDQHGAARSDVLDQAHELRQALGGTVPWELAHQLLRDGPIPYWLSWWELLPELVGPEESNRFWDQLREKLLPRSPEDLKGHFEASKRGVGWETPLYRLARWKWEEEVLPSEECLLRRTRIRPGLVEEVFRTAAHELERYLRGLEER